MKGKTLYALRRKYNYGGGTGVDVYSTLKAIKRKIPLFTILSYPAWVKEFGIPLEIDVVKELRLIESK